MVAVGLVKVADYDRRDGVASHIAAGISDQSSRTRRYCSAACRLLPSGSALQVQSKTPWIIHSGIPSWSSR